MTEQSKLPWKPRKGFVVSVTEELPPVRRFSAETIAAWVAEDEADMREFEKNSPSLK